MSLSEIRVNTTKTRTGVGTITYTETGPVITGIATASNFKTGSTNVHSTGVELANINTGGSTATFGGPISGTTASFSGTVSIGGTLTYEDVTNIDSVGIITAREGVQITADNKYLKIGADNDISIVHTGSESFIANATGHLTRRSNVHKWENYAGNAEYVRIDSSGRVLINQIAVGAKSAPAPLQLVSSTSGAFGLNISMRSNNDYGFISYTDNDASEDLVQLGVQRTAADTGDLIIYANAGNTSATERLRIRSDGKLQIGSVGGNSTYRTTSTNAALDIWGDGSAYPTLRLGTEVLDTEGEDIRFGRTDHGATDIRYHSIISRHMSSGASNYLQFRIHDGGGSPFQSQKTVLHLNGLGKVGIGEDSPDELLHIASTGTAKFRLTDNRTSISDGSQYGVIQFEQRDSNTPGVSAEVAAVMQDTTNGNTAIQFRTGTPSTIGERLRITGSGQLIMTNAATQTFTDFSTTNNNTRGVISVAGKDGSGNAVTVKIGGFGDTSRGEIFTHSNHGLGFATNNAATQMLLTTDGDLLVGTTTGAYRLNVREDLNSGGNLAYFGNSDSTYSQGLTLSFDSNKDIEWSGGSGAGGMDWNMGTRGYKWRVGGSDRALLSQYAYFTLDSGSQSSNSKPGIELKSTGYTGNVTRLFQDSPNANSVLETTERSLVLDLDSGNQVNGTNLSVHIDGTEEFRFDPGSLEFKNSSNTSRGTLLGGINYYSNTNLYVDLTQWRLSDNWNVLEVFGYVNPNSSGSGQYTDPVHMYIYRGVGYNSGIKNYIYSVHVAPPARQAFPGGSGMSGNSGVSAVWYHPSSGIVGNESATSTHYIRLVIPNANASNNFQKTFRILRRF